MMSDHPMPEHQKTTLNDWGSPKVMLPTLALLAATFLGYELVSTEDIAKQSEEQTQLEKDIVASQDVIHELKMEAEKSALLLKISEERKADIDNALGKILGKFDETNATIFNLKMLMSVGERWALQDMTTLVDDYNQRVKEKLPEDIQVLLGSPVDIQSTRIASETRAKMKQGEE